MRVFGPPTKVYHCATFDWNRYSSFDNMQVLIFYELRWKTPSYAPEWGFGGLEPLNGLLCQRNPKRHTTSFRDSALLEVAFAKIRRRV